MVNSASGAWGGQRSEVKGRAGGFGLVRDDQNKVKCLQRFGLERDDQRFTLKGMTCEQSNWRFGLE